MMSPDDKIYKECPLRRKLTLKNFKNVILFLYGYINKIYIPDFICFDKIIIELKALSAITSEHQAQVLNYLKASKLHLGLILNFGKQSFEHKRIIKEK